MRRWWCSGSLVLSLVHWWTGYITRFRGDVSMIGCHSCDWLATSPRYFPAPSSLGCFCAPQLSEASTITRLQDWISSRWTGDNDIKMYTAWDFPRGWMNLSVTASRKRKQLTPNSVIKKLMAAALITFISLKPCWPQIIKRRHDFTSVDSTAPRTQELHHRN